MPLKWKNKWRSVLKSNYSEKKISAFPNGSGPSRITVTYQFDLRTSLHLFHFIQITVSLIIYSHLSFRHIEPCSYDRTCVTHKNYFTTYNVARHESSKAQSVQAAFWYGSWVRLSLGSQEFIFWVIRLENAFSFIRAYLRFQFVLQYSSTLSLVWLCNIELNCLTKLCTNEKLYLRILYVPVELNFSHTWVGFEVGEYISKVHHDCWE